jgi:hypothetical protein
MHLWPERVIPKCVEDRSLAVAHGLESLFWVADASTEDRWIPCGAAAAAAVELVGKLRIPAVEVARERIVNR